MVPWEIEAKLLAQSLVASSGRLHMPSCVFCRHLEKNSSSLPPCFPTSISTRENSGSSGAGCVLTPQTLSASELYVLRYPSHPMGEPPLDADSQLREVTCFAQGHSARGGGPTWAGVQCIPVSSAGFSQGRAALWGNRPTASWAKSGNVLTQMIRRAGVWERLRARAKKTAKDSELETEFLIINKL